MSILDEIRAYKLADVAAKKAALPLVEVEAAARQVATITALVPLAFADVFAALTANLRMIRRIAEIYGGRSGTLGSWRLTRAVMAHLVATGAVAIGDDMLEPVLGGGLLGKLSRRFGEGLVNGALSARVGVAAMEVRRPLPFSDRHKPSSHVDTGDFVIVINAAMAATVVSWSTRRTFKHEIDCFFYQQSTHNDCLREDSNCHRHNSRDYGRHNSEGCGGGKVVGGGPEPYAGVYCGKCDAAGQPAQTRGRASGP